MDDQNTRMVYSYIKGSAGRKEELVLLPGQLPEGARSLVTYDYGPHKRPVRAVLAVGEMSKYLTVHGLTHGPFAPEKKDVSFDPWTGRCLEQECGRCSTSLGATAGLPA